MGEKDLKKAIKALETALEEAPASEAPLRALIDVEEELKVKLAIEELSEEAKIQIDSTLEDITGKTIPAYLDVIHDKASRAMESDYLEAKENLEGYLKRLKIVHRKVKKVILNPDETGGILAGSGNGIKNPELETNKLQHLLELLRENQIYTDDICIVTGENHPNMMREGSYLCIEIPKIKRTIMLHCGYGEASFVLYDIYERGTLFRMTKEEIQAQFGATKVIYTEKDLGKWGQAMLEALRLEEADFQPKINMAEYDERQFFIEEIKKLYPTAEEFINLSNKEKRDIRILGFGLTKIRTLLINDRKLSPLSRKIDMAYLALEIYEESHEVIYEIIEKALKEEETENWEKERWIEEVKKRYPTPEEFMSLEQKEKRKVRIKGKSLGKLAAILIGEKGLNPAQRNMDMAKLGIIVYGEGQEVLEKMFWGKEQWAKKVKEEFPTAEEFMTLQSAEKEDLKIKGAGLKKLAVIITGIKGLNPLSRIKDMATLALAIYGKGHEVIEEVLKEEETENWGKERWIEEVKKQYPTPEEFMSFNQKDKSSIKVYEKGLYALAGLITGRSGLNPIGRTKDMAILALAIYGKGHEVIEEVLKEEETENWEKERWIEEVKKQYPTPEEFMSLKAKERQEIFIYGKGLAALATLITVKSNMRPAANITDMATLALAIYGNGYEVIEQVFKEGEANDWTKERWIQEIKALYPTAEDFFALDYEQRNELKIRGKGLYALANLLMEEKGLNPIKVKKDLIAFVGFIYQYPDKK